VEQALLGEEVTTEDDDDGDGDDGDQEKEEGKGVRPLGLAGNDKGKGPASAPDNADFREKSCESRRRGGGRRHPYGLVSATRGMYGAVAEGDSVDGVRRDGDHATAEKAAAETAAAPVAVREGVAVVDNVFSEATLASLLRMCQESTTFFDLKVPRYPCVHACVFSAICKHRLIASHCNAKALFS